MNKLVVIEREIEICRLLYEGNSLRNVWYTYPADDLQILSLFADPQLNRQY